MQVIHAFQEPDAFINRQFPRIMDTATAEGFLTERDELSRRLTQAQQSAVGELETALPDWRDPTGGFGRFSALSAAFRQRFEPSTFSNINKFVVVDLVLRLEEAIASRNLPNEILTMYPAAASRLLTYVQNLSDHDYSYPDDDFLKDLRFASGLSVPSRGAQDIDLRAAIGYRASARWLLRNPSARYARGILRWGQVAPWCRIHTQSRYLDDFNEAGFEACYIHIAALLRAHSEVLGLASTSWLYDPQLESVSPRLTYVRLRPVERGASIVWSGTSDFDIRSATLKSANRRRLYAEGKYIPVSYTLLWPREKILAWANSQCGEPS
jgi:hypothetical protein